MGNLRADGFWPLVTWVTTNIQQNSLLSLFRFSLVLFQLFSYSRCLPLKSDLLILLIIASLVSMLSAGM